MAHVLAADELLGALDRCKLREAETLGDPGKLVADDLHRVDQGAMLGA